MRIDSHQHFWTLGLGYYDWLTPEMGKIYRDFGPNDLKPKLDAAGIDGTILVQAAATVAETEFMLSVADQHDWIFGVVGWVDFDNPAQAVDDLDRLAENPKLVGIRPMIENLPDTRWLLKPEYDPVFRKLIDLGLTFDVLARTRLLDPLREFLDRYSDLPCVIDHCAKPFIADCVMQPWADKMARIAADFDVYCKLSGLTTEAAPNWKADDITPYVDRILDVFGPKRVMMGSDWPMLDVQSDYAEWMRLVDGWLDGYPDADRDAILGDTAAAFYLGG